MNCGIMSLCADILTSQEDFGIISATFVSHLFTYYVRFFPLSENESSSWGITVSTHWCRYNVHQRLSGTTGQNETPAERSKNSSNAQNTLVVNKKIALKGRSDFYGPIPRTLWSHCVWYNAEFRRNFKKELFKRFYWNKIIFMGSWTCFLKNWIIHYCTKVGSPLKLEYFSTHCLPFHLL